MEESIVLLYVLLCDTLYSIQSSNTSEEAGGQDNHSLYSEILNDLRLPSLK